LISLLIRDFKGSGAFLGGPFWQWPLAESLNITFSFYLHLNFQLDLIPVIP